LPHHPAENAGAFAAIAARYAGLAMVVTGIAATQSHAALRPNTPCSRSLRELIRGFHSPATDRLLSGALVIAVVILPCLYLAADRPCGVARAIRTSMQESPMRMNTEVRSAPIPLVSLSGKKQSSVNNSSKCRSIQLGEFMRADGAVLYLTRRWILPPIGRQAKAPCG
jgi:hypothetical protein